MFKGIGKTFEKYGAAAGIIALIIALAIVFGILCGCAAIFMCIWNYAVVAAVTICVEIGFWHALCIIIAPLFMCGVLTRIGSED